MLAYYANSQGWGHLQFASQFAREMDLVIFSSHPEVAAAGDRTVTLADDLPDESAWPLELVPPPGYLHYAPIGTAKIRNRYRQLLDAWRGFDVSFLIVDVSVEMAAFARLCAIPYAYVRLMGDRDDSAHRMAYEGAVFLIAYFPAALESPETPTWIMQKTIYMGFFSRFSSLGEMESSTGRRIVVVSGNGGDVPGTQINHRNIGHCFPNHEIEIFGPHPPEYCPPNGRYFGRVADLSPHLRGADGIIATSGANLVSEIATFGLRYLAVPEARPYQEQLRMAQALAERGLCALVTTNEPHLAELAAALQPEWADYTQPDAVRRFAKWFLHRRNDLSLMVADVQRSSPDVPFV